MGFAALCFYIRLQCVRILRHRALHFRGQYQLITFCIAHINRSFFYTRHLFQYRFQLVQIMNCVP